MTRYVLLAVDHATLAVHIAGVTPSPDSAFMAQLGRDLTAMVGGFLRDRRYQVVDRDSKFTAHFGELLQREGVKLVRTAAAAPNIDAISVRRVLSVESECLSRWFRSADGSCAAPLIPLVVPPAPIPIATCRTKGSATS